MLRFINCVKFNFGKKSSLSSDSHTMLFWAALFTCQDGAKTSDNAICFDCIFQTYTIQGTRENTGVIQRTIDELFIKITSSSHVKIFLSFAAIRENVFHDFLGKNYNERPLRIYHEKTGSPYIRGGFTHYSFKEPMKIRVYCQEQYMTYSKGLKSAPLNAYECHLL